MGEFVKVATVDEVKDGSGKAVEANGQKIALFNVGGKFHAIENTCKHMGGPLGEGSLDGNKVSCPWHGWQYDVTSGKNETDDSMGVKLFPTKIEGNDVMVEV
jgi:nitrite reductase (NADH) small subunit